MVLKETVLLTWLLGLVWGGGGGGPVGAYKPIVGGRPIGGPYGGPYAGSNAIGPAVAGGPALVGGAGRGGVGGPDFNPVLLQGVRGYPGIRARINQRAFQYASGLLAQLINQEVKRARIPPITQSPPGGIQGCVMIYNLYVSRYRCPQRVTLYPAPPNRLVLQVDNVDIGITGNLGGQIVVLIPIPLNGIIQLNVYQVSIMVDLVLERGINGPYARMLSCNIQVGFADAYVENGGLIGEIINSQFRQQISQQVREMIPRQVCGMLPNIVNERLNSRLSGLPQSIAVTQLLSMFSGILAGLTTPQSPPPQFCQQCQAMTAASPASQIPQTTATATSGGSAAVAAPAATGSGTAPQIPNAAYNERPAARGALQKVYHTQQASTTIRRVPSNVVVVAPTIKRREVAYLEGDTRRIVVRNKRQTGARNHSVTGKPTSTAVSHLVRRAVGSPVFRAGRGSTAYGGQFSPAVAGGPAMLAGPNAALCARCPPPGSSDPMNFIRQLISGLDMRKLSDLYLSLQLLGTHSTQTDYTLDLTGEFSPNAQGGTPFGAFPVQFPYAYDSHMAEFILSDYTINSLFYWLHRKQFITFRIGPETPQIGDLLKTTCNEDEEDESLEASEVQLDSEEDTLMRRIRRKVAKLTLKTWRNRRSLKKGRGKRQDVGSLADLGICFGDILPAVRERYPNQRIAIVIRTARAPSILLSAARGGMATLDLVADADIYIDGTNNRVGTITIASTIVIVAQLHGNRLVGTAQIANLRLTDTSGTLGLPQDALDNLGNLGKELIQKLINDAMQRGIPINIPQGGLAGLPINIVNPTVRIIEHGLYIGTDLTVSPSLLGIEATGC